MAKRTTKALNLRSKHETRNYQQGMGYFVPPGVTPEQWKKLKQTWEKKLANSGHNEIEQFATNCSGHFSPFFTKTAESNSRSGGAATEAAQYRPDVAEYYRRVGLFRHHADLLTLFKHHAYLYTFLLEMLSDGVIYSDMVKWLRTKAPRPLKAKKSIYWAFYHVKNIEAVMHKWFKDNPDWLEDES